MPIQSKFTGSGSSDWLISDQLADAFRMEEQAGLKLATQARLVALRFRTYGDQVWESPASLPIYNPMTKSVRDLGGDMCPVIGIPRKERSGACSLPR